MKNGYVYKITSPVGRVYIGSTCDLKNRKRAYKGLQCKKQTGIYRSLLKYGFDAHVFEVIWEGDFNEMYKKEREFGLLFNVLNKDFGLNHKLPDDEGRPYLISEEVGKSISIAKKGKCSGVNNPFFGKKHTEEALYKMKEAGKVRALKIKGIENPNYGNKWTDEQKESMRQKQKSLPRFYSEEERKKRSEWMKAEMKRNPRSGRKTSEETKAIFRQQRKRGLHPRSKIIIDIEAGVFYDCIMDVAELYNVDRKKIANMLNGVTKNTTNLRYAV